MELNKKVFRVHKNRISGTENFMIKKKVVVLKLKYLMYKAGIEPQTSDPQFAKT